MTRFLTFLICFLFMTPQAFAVERLVHEDYEDQAWGDGVTHSAGMDTDNWTIVSPPSGSGGNNYPQGGSNYCARTDYGGADNQNQQWVYPGSYTQEIFFRFYFMYGTQSDFGISNSPNHKLLRVMSNNPEYTVMEQNLIRTTSTYKRLHLHNTINQYVDYPAYEGGAHEGFNLIDKDEWHKVEFYVKLNSPASSSNGISKIWLDDSLRYNNTSLQWITTDVNKPSWWKIPGQFGTAAKSDPCYYYIDGIEIFGDQGSDSVTGTMAGGDIEAGGADTTPPTLSSPSPSSQQTCTSNPRDVTIQITATDDTDVTACKYDTIDIDIDSMAWTLTEGLSDAWRDTVSNNCASSYTYYAKCEDAADNESGATTISYSIGPAEQTVGLILGPGFF